MRKIRIKFTDFWFGFCPDSNYFFELLSRFFIIELSEEPEILIYSCYGREYLKYSSVRVFYSGENIRPDFSGCDFAIGFDYNKDPRYYRLPLYAIYIDQHEMLAKLLEARSKEKALEIWRSKTKFCCMVVSNSKSKKRLLFFKKLSKYKKVDSGGKTLNNIGGPVKDKIDFIRDYRFVIAFENSGHPGYTTEKIVEPLFTNCIPLYWGNPLVGNEFNINCFLNLDDTISEDEFIKQIIAVDNDEEKAIKMLMQPKFTGNMIPADINKDSILKFFEKIINAKDSCKPVAVSKKKYLHAFNLKKRYYTDRLKGMMNKEFR